MLNLFLFDNKNIKKPEWSPMLKGYKSGSSEHVINTYPILPFDGLKFICVDNFLTKELCDSLISQFEEQFKSGNVHPVGVSGFSNVEDKTEIGSWRANSWLTNLSILFTEEIRRIMLRSNIDVNSKEFITPFKKHEKYQLLGSTPWMRFMKYLDGGRHVAHYDAPFVKEDENYLSLFSWVLYLNTPDGTGGSFQFVKDEQYFTKDISEWNRDDWDHVSEEISHSIAPVSSRLLIFPHWLCHQVEQFKGNGFRYIIRGDLAYSHK